MHGCDVLSLSGLEIGEKVERMDDNRMLKIFYTQNIGRSQTERWFGCFLQTRGFWPTTDDMRGDFFL
jgi:hypothetical protein